MRSAAKASGNRNRPRWADLPVEGEAEDIQALNQETQQVLARSRWVDICARLCRIARSRWIDIMDRWRIEEMDDSDDSEDDSENAGRCV